MSDMIKENYRSHKEASVDTRKTSNISKNIGPYILEKTLGEGTFGKVKLGTHILTGEKVAVKILEKIKIIEQSDKARVEREIKILKQLRHHNIIQIYQIIQTRTNLYLIMEYAPGDELFKYICNKKRLSEIEACKYFQQIISGVEYLHKLRIVHRDLKPENLLLDHNKDIKIVDFGLSNIYGKGELLKTPCGSPCYAAPEMIDGKRYSGLMVDVWSCGIILFAMICGFLPFDDTNNDILYKKIIVGEFKIPSSVSDKAKDLIKRILTTDPSQRYNIKQIKSHPWLNLVKLKPNEGLFISVHKIPIDTNVLKKMEDYGFEENEVREHLNSNKHDHITTTYYLLLKRQSKNGITSIADLVSNEYHSFICDAKNFINYVQVTEEKTKPNKESIGSYSYSTPKNRESMNKTEFEDSLERKKSEKSKNSKGLTKEEKKQVLEVKKFKKVEKKPTNKKPLRNVKRLLDTKIKSIPQKENINTPKHNISKKNSSNSDKKTTITINNINTNISINTTINIPENTDASSIVINPEIKKFEVISKESGKQDNFVKVIVNSNLNNQKTRDKHNNQTTRKYNFQTNFIDTSTSFDFNQDRRNESFDNNEKRSLRLEMNIFKKKEISQKNSKTEINTVPTENALNMDEGGKKSARTPNLKSEFQTINEDDEFKKNETKAKNNIKTKLLSRLQDKNDWNINKNNNKKKNVLTLLPKHKKIFSDIPYFKQKSCISSRDDNIHLKRTKKSDDHLSSTPKCTPKPIFNTIHVNSIDTQSKPSSHRESDKTQPIITTPKSNSLQKVEQDTSNHQNSSKHNTIQSNTATRLPSQKALNDFSQMEVKICSDPFDLDCLSFRLPNDLKEDLSKVLDEMNIIYKNFGSHYRFRCSKTDVKFDIEICKLKETENCFILKFEKVEGSQLYFKESTSKVIANLKFI